MIIGILLAGGKSERMGRDKGALVLDGETLGARAARVLRAVCNDVVCAGHGRGVPEDVARFPDRGDGPLVALAATLAFLAERCDGTACTFVVLPVDMPGIDASHLALLLAAQGRAHAACFVIDGRVEPLPAVLALAAARGLADDVTRGRRRLGDAVRALAPATVGLPGHDGRNINSPEDLHAWSAARAGR